MKLCKNCDNSTLGFDCKAIKGKTNPIDGNAYTTITTCSFARQSEFYCGAEAKWFKSKEPEIALCPDGHKPEVFGGGTVGYFISCGHPEEVDSHWCGPTRATKEEAISDWNRVMKTP